MQKPVTPTTTFGFKLIAVVEFWLVQLPSFTTPTFELIQMPSFSTPAIELIQTIGYLL